MNHLIVCDLSAIEHRVVGWIARCKAIMECHRLKHDPYIDFAPYLYAGKNYTYEGLKSEYDLYEATKGAQGREDFRQLAKPPVLGGGFGLGGGELQINEYGDEMRTGLWGYALNVCGVDMKKEEAHLAVAVYRKINWEVPVLWTDMEMAFKWVMENPKSKITVGKITWDKDNREWRDVLNNDLGSYITFSCVQSESVGNIVRMQLPSGRYLHYLGAHTEREKFKYVDKRTGKTRTAEGDVIYYQGIEHSASDAADGSIAKKQHKWGKVKTYGGKLTENAVQAVARDILVNGCRLAEDMGISIWGVFHDEIAAEVNDAWDAPTLEDLRWAMSEPPAWGKTLLLDANGYTGNFYRKG
jgi:hypothetical protein